MASPYKYHYDEDIAVERLIVVCCHAIWLGGSKDGDCEAEWAIEPFQEGETPTFMAHIESGLACLKSQSESLIVFSGSVISTVMRFTDPL